MSYSSFTVCNHNNRTSNLLKTKAKLGKQKRTMLSTLKLIN